jgi:ribosome-binding factor A
MAKKRIARVNEQMKRELIMLVQSEVRDPRIGLVTITDVEVSPDLYHAKVFFSVRGDEDERKSAGEGLRAASGFLRSEIAKRMQLRKSPELHFSYDDTLTHAMNIERLLQEARAGNAPDATAEPDDDDASADAADNDDAGDDDGTDDDDTGSDDDGPRSA